MEKYGVMKELACITCGTTLQVRNNITDPEIEKLSQVTDGHLHVWKEVAEDEQVSDQSGDVQP